MATAGRKWLFQLCTHLKRCKSWLRVPALTSARSLLDRAPRTKFDKFSQTIRKTVPPGWVTMLDVSAVLNQDVPTLIAGYRIICEPRCGNPIITFYNRCGLSRFSGVLRSFCSRNDAGGFCYEDFGTLIPNSNSVARSCIPRVSTCTTSCQSSLTAFRNSNGCCLNILNNTVFSSGANSFILPTLDNDLWSDCGVDTPGFCDIQTSSLSAAEGPFFAKVFYLLTLAVTAVLLF